MLDSREPCVKRVVGRLRRPSRRSMLDVHVTLDLLVHRFVRTRGRRFSVFLRSGQRPYPAVSLDSELTTLSARGCSRFLLAGRVHHGGIDGQEGALLGVVEARVDPNGLLGGRYIILA